MWGSDKKQQRVKIDTLIGQHTEIRGDLHFSGGLHVDGVINGDVIAEEGSSSTLVLSEHGRIDGMIRVPNMVLDGVVNGDVHGSEHIELASCTHVTGDVYYKMLEMAMGAEVNGRLVHGAEALRAVADVTEIAARPNT
ncbi:MAG: polymer-forming cytoskeletal protein [Gammaproteobacteria bacterium]|nr:polymer-forming cytoskeletal protein [Gammaproteobacteria bacterium]